MNCTRDGVEEARVLLELDAEEEEDEEEEELEQLRNVFGGVRGMLEVFLILDVSGVLGIQYTRDAGGGIDAAGKGPGINVDGGGGAGKEAGSLTEGEGVKEGITVSEQVSFASG